MQADSAFETRPSRARTGLSTWSFCALQTCAARVIPDGCRDFLVVARSNRRTHWKVSNLEAATVQVMIQRGDRVDGIRLAPGIRIDGQGLRHYLQDRDPYDLFAADRIDEFCVVATSASEMLACLAGGASSVAGAAARLGVSTRTLQREVKAATSRPPWFWLALARARRTARDLVFLIAASPAS